MLTLEPKILIIEDEASVALTIKQGLCEASYEVIVTGNGAEGLAQFQQQTPDMVILDLNLPGMDGLEVLKRLRSDNNSIPVLILSARDTIDDRVVGLDGGANDYLVKPFAFPELLARIRVLLRRDQPRILDYTLGDLKLDALSRHVSRGSDTLNLTPREFEVLELLLRNVHKPVSRQVIASEIWRVQRATSLDNVIDVHLMRLRKKIDTDYTQKLIHTLRGLGYVITDRIESLL